MRLPSLLIGMIVLAVPFHAQAPQPQTTITGRVVAEATGQPVRRAYVIAHGPATKTTRVTMSDGEGRFTFDGLPTDRYRVGASKRPLLSAATDAADTEIVINLPTGAVVTGTAIDQSGRPEPGLELNISGSGLLSPQVATTNHLGEYRFFSLPGGEYVIGPVRRKGESRALTVAPAAYHHVPALSMESPDPPVIPGREAPSAGNAVVSGVATDARSGGPLANATVVSRQSGRRAVTDANGHFQIEGLGKGTYTLLLQGEALPTSAAEVTVEDNTRIGDVTLTGGRSGSISGAVRDDVGDPVVNMPVAAYLKRTVNFQSMYLGRGHTRTDDRGVFDLRNLPPGDYLLCACAGEPLALDPLLLRLLGPTAPDTATVSRLIDDTVQTFAPTFYPGLTRASDSHIVTVDYGDERIGMDITMYGVTPFAVSGRLVASGGFSVGGMQAFLTQDGDVPGAIGVSATPPVTIAADGRFRFSGVAPGKYSLGAIPGGAGNRAPWGQAAFTLADRDIADLIVTVGNGVALKGRVEFSGSASRPAPAILEKAHVLLAPVDVTMSMFLAMGNGTGSVGHSALVDPAGQFAVEGMPPGRYHVMVTVPNSPWRTVQRLSAVDAVIVDETITIGPDGATNLLITMSDAPLATLTGTLPIDLKRYESAGFSRVNIFPMDPAMWLEPERYPKRFAWVGLNRDGSFRVEDIPPGDYYVARGSSFDPDMSRSAFERWSKTAERVTLRAGETTTVNLRR